MKFLTITLTFIGLIFTSPVHAAPEKASKYFDSIKLYVDRDYVLNDTLEFALFDMSELKVINNSKEIDIKQSISENEDKPTPAPTLSGLNESKGVLENLPKYFYRALREQLENKNVPITLYASPSPDYAKPLQLFIKLKKITILPYEAKGGNFVQPVAVRIYGQIKDKKSQETLIKFYDSQEAKFYLGRANAKVAYEDMADQLMKDLASYLKTRY